MNSSPDKRSLYSETARTARSIKTARDAKESDQSVQVPEGLFVRLKNCLLVQAKFKEAFRHLRDGLGGTQALSSFPSVSSLQASDQSSIKETTTNSKSKVSTLRRTQNESKNHGILMSEEDVIFNHLDTFCARAKNIIDEMTILSQYKHLAKTSIGLSRPKKEDLGLDNVDENGNEDTDIENSVEELQDSEDDLNDAESFNDNHPDSAGIFFSAKNKNMDPLVEEDDEVDFSRENSSIKFDLKKSRKSSSKSIKKQNKSIVVKHENSDTDLKKKVEIATDRTENDISEIKNEEAENLFKTEDRTEEDVRRIFKKTQILSKEDLRVLRMYATKMQ